MELEEKPNLVFGRLGFFSFPLSVLESIAFKKESAGSVQSAGDKQTKNEEIKEMKKMKRISLSDFAPVAFKKETARSAGEN